MHTEQAFVGDGMEFEAVIPRSPGIHPRAAITYRPCTAEERNKYLRSDMAKRASEAAELIGKHVKEWDLRQKADGPVAEVSRKLAEKLQPMLQDKIIDLLTGYAGSAEEATDLKNS